MTWCDAGMTAGDAHSFGHLCEDPTPTPCPNSLFPDARLVDMCKTFPKDGPKQFILQCLCSFSVKVKLFGEYTRIDNFFAS